MEEENFSIFSQSSTDGATCRVTYTVARACKNNKTLTTLVIGNQVTSIGNATFSGYSNRKTVTIGTGLKKLWKGKGL